MTYKMGKVMGRVEQMPAWVQNLVTYGDLREIVDDFEVVTTQEIDDALFKAARERRDNQ